MPKNPSALSDTNLLEVCLKEKFLLLDGPYDPVLISSEVKLCIVLTDFSRTHLNEIKHILSTNKNIEFWICSENLSKENIVKANKIGIKTVISSPIDMSLVEDFFVKRGDCLAKSKYISTDCYSLIAGLNVMIVDDNILNIELLKEVLLDMGLNISSFSKPKEAYNVALSNKFDLFLLDVMMPEMSGFELAKKILNIEHNKNSQIVFVSALSDSDNKIKGYNLGSCAYISKPFDIDLVKSRIFNLLKTRRAQDSITSNKEQYLANIAHDLKTPINAGINALKLLLKENFGELDLEQQEIVEDILSSTIFMKDIVENLLCKSKLDNDKMDLSKQVYSLKELIEHCIDLTKYILSSKKQKIEFICDVENTLLPLDFLEIKRAIHNLIANASEYSPHGGKIIIKIFESDENIGVFVQDFGRGIDVNLQDDVFTQYITQAKKYKTVGFGLGLYITKKIVEAHKGEILLESTPGKGTKITILLPVYTKS